jgi:hypothetical protein
MIVFMAHPHYEQIIIGIYLLIVNRYFTWVSSDFFLPEFLWMHLDPFPLH